MKIREVDTSVADQISAKVFFDSVRGLWDISEWKVLDAFARNGQLTVSNYGMDVGELHLWELSDQHKHDLQLIAAKRGKKKTSIHFGCSYEHVARLRADGAIDFHKYDMVVIDTPQGIHHDWLGIEQTEHFGFLNFELPWLLKDESFVVLYVNKKPYNAKELGSHGYDEYEEYDYDKWMRNRSSFYGARVVDEGQAISTYARLFGHYGFDVNQVVVTPCFSDVQGLAPYSFRLGLSLRKRVK